MDIRAWIEPLKDVLPPGALAIASADHIRRLSYGEVKLPDLLNHKTGVPTPRGLLCTTIFGPVDDQTSRIGHVELATPVLHPWLGPLVCTLLGWTDDELRRVLVGDEYVDFVLGALTNTRAVFEKLRYTKSDLLEDCTALMMDVLPILPPSRRGSGDVNTLYRRTINRNNRLSRLQQLRAPEDILRKEERMVQESIEQLFDNENRNVPVLEGDRKLRSLGSLTIEALKSNPDDRVHLQCIGFSTPHRVGRDLNRWIR